MMTQSFKVRVVFPELSSGTKAAGVLKFEGDFPALRGSEKQVAWAQEIRDRCALGYAEQVAESAGVKLGLVDARDADCAEYVSDIEARIAAALANEPEIYAFAVSVLSQADARYWIDRRDEGPRLSTDYRMKTGNRSPRSGQFGQPK